MVILVPDLRPLNEILLLSADKKKPCGFQNSESKPNLLATLSTFSDLSAIVNGSTWRSLKLCLSWQVFSMPD